MNYFVTGATGFIGGRVARQLLAAGHEVVTLARMIALIGAVVPLPELYSAEGIRSSAGVSYLGTNEKARRELGYAPRTLEQGLPETLEYEMQQLGMRFPKR